jgi:hypothetical protein
VFHQEQHIEPLQHQRVDTEEVGAENAPGLHPQELAPAGPVAARAGSMPARWRIDHTVLAAIW